MDLKKKGVLFLSSRSLGARMLPAIPVLPSPLQAERTELPTWPHGPGDPFDCMDVLLDLQAQKRTQYLAAVMNAEASFPPLRLSLSILTKFASAFVAEVLVGSWFWTQSHTRSDSAYSKIPHLQEWPQSFIPEPGKLKLAFIIDHMPSWPTSWRAPLYHHPHLHPHSHCAICRLYTTWFYVSSQAIDWNA